MILLRWVVDRKALPDHDPVRRMRTADIAEETPVRARYSVLDVDFERY